MEEIMKTLSKYKKELYKKDPELKALVAEELERLKISEALKSARKAAGMTQKQVADRMNVNRALISQLEGRPQNVTVSTLVRYAAAVGGHMDFKISQNKPRRNAVRVSKVARTATRTS
jgi:DNA-binding XRE family transcriptional regulator